MDRLEWEKFVVIAWAIAISIVLNALGTFAIRIAAAIAINKKANRKD